MWYLNRPQLQGKAVLELGCGTGLPGLVAASCGASCLLTDDEDALPVLKNTRVVLMTNNPVHYYTFSATGGDTNPLQLSFEPIFLSSSKVAPFSWASFSPSFISSFYSQDGSQATWPDLIIAADCFYDNSSSYDSIFATLDFFFTKHPGCKFITTYQVRSSQRSLQWLATKKWGFKVRSIPTDGSDNGFCFPQEKYDILQQVQLIEISP
jgi:hypothetical protein